MIFQNTWTFLYVYRNMCHKVLLTLSVTVVELPFSHGHLVQMDRSNCLPIVYNEQQLAHIMAFRDQNVTKNLALLEWRFVPTAITVIKNLSAFRCLWTHNQPSLTQALWWWFRNCRGGRIWIDALRLRYIWSGTTPWDYSRYFYWCKCENRVMVSIQESESRVVSRGLTL